MLIQRDEIEKKHDKVIKKAIQIMKEVEKTDGLKHGMEHINAVVEAMTQIIEKMPEDIIIDKEACIVSAYWHDTGRIKQSEGHAQISAEMLVTELENLDYGKEFVNICYNAIINHSYCENSDGEDQKKSEVIEAKILRDADKLSFLDIIRWKRYIQIKHKSTIIERLPKYKNVFLSLEESREIFDEKVIELTKLMYDYIINGV